MLSTKGSFKASLIIFNFKGNLYFTKSNKAPFQDAREWVNKFVRGYNNEHFHSGIKFITPIQRHVGEDDKILRKRTAVYLKAKNLHPYRWSREVRNWEKEPIAMLKFYR